MTMKKFAIQALALVVAIIGALYLTYNSSKQGSFLSLFTGKITPTPTLTQSSSNSQMKQIKIGNVLINVEIADTKELRNKGLGGRSSLDANSGMLFVFSDKGRYEFWMKDMKIPLDFIFINDTKVVDLIKNIPPPSDPTRLTIYQPSTDVNMVVEVNAGFVDKHNIEIGQTVYLVK